MCSCYRAAKRMRLCTARTSSERHRARTIEPQSSIVLAAHAHTVAATAHGKGNHLTAHELSKQAHEHSMANKLVEELGTKAARVQQQPK